MPRVTVAATLAGARTRDDLERGREAYSRCEWRAAYELLTHADQGSDLELLATSAYMLGWFDEYMRLLERAYQRHAEEPDAPRAVRCAFWIGINHARRGEMGPASGWLGRAQRLLERQEGECVEQGYMLIPVVFQHDAAGDLEGAAATAASAAEIGERFGDADLFALAVHTQGEILLKDGRVREGLALLDEAMVALTTGELSPIVTGIVYCGVILACETVYELRRAQEWTAALTRWCREQPDLLAFTGRCRVHRAELMRVHGEWRGAIEEARRASERSADATMSHAAAGRACYLEGEVHRLRGEFTSAETAYREASRLGYEPQPGLALLRLAQGDRDGAAATIRRALSETTDRSRRASLLPAAVEILLAIGDVQGANGACSELGQIADAYESSLLQASSAQARGAVELAAGNAEAALQALRQAVRAWHELEAPYEAAQTRVLLGLACKALGDADAFALELDAARSTFDALGAGPEVARVESLVGGAPPESHGLTPRELEVLRLVASGKSNREIAESLVVSEHTVARHVQNIFTKLGVASRTAAGAFAYEHQLV
jgi:DNA-binding CsgD family transcriptional regulator/tetratricopeptide (TPR) repeat protein